MKIFLYMMHTDDEKDSLITFAGFGKQTGSVSSASTSSDAGSRQSLAAAAASLPTSSPAGVLIVM